MTTRQRFQLAAEPAHTRLPKRPLDADIEPFGMLNAAQNTVLRLQQTRGNQAVQRLLAPQRSVQREDASPAADGTDLTEANKFNAGLARGADLSPAEAKVGKGQLWLQQAQDALRDYGSGGLIYPQPNESWEMVLLPLTRAIKKWQAENITDVPATGKLDDATRTALTPLMQRTPADWAKRDTKEAQAVLSDEKAATDQRDKAIQGGRSADDAARDAVVSLARSQVGTVFAGPGRGDGKKYGWERIKRYYTVSEEAERRAKGMMAEPSGDQLKGIQGAGTFANQTSPSDKKTGDWSWCGLFAAWVIKTVTGKGDWRMEPNVGGHMTGLPTLDKTKDLRRVKRGDVIVLSNSVHHHFIVAKDHTDDSDTYEGVEGNAEGQDIRLVTLSLDAGKIDTIYSLADAYTPPAAATSTTGATSTATPDVYNPTEL